MRLGLAIILWFIIVFITIANGTFSDNTVSHRYGEYAANVEKNVCEVAIIIFFSGIYAYGTRGEKWLNAALGAGITWIILTTALDLVLAVYDFGYKFDTLLFYYRFTNQRLWAIILPVQIASPLIMGLLLNREN
jgi:hypothetical protein